MDEDGCRVVSGQWRDFFSGTIITNPRQLDIDHVVPLKEAHESGAYAWDYETRKAFANDLDTSGTWQLRAVLARYNRQKGARDPAEWMPLVNKCEYAVDWIAIKRKYKLTFDPVEKAALLKIKERCSKF